MAGCQEHGLSENDGAKVCHGSGGLTLRNPLSAANGSDRCEGAIA